jgi:predicted enzyme related to lactoylglutathione lyase
MNAINLVVYPTADIAKAKAFFSKILDVEPYADSPYYVGYKTGDIEIGVAPSAAQHTSGALAYVDVSDIHAALAGLVANGAEKLQDVTDVSGGLLTAIVRTPDGASIGLRQFPKT